MQHKIHHVGLRALLDPLRAAGAMGGELGELGSELIF